MSPNRKYSTILYNRWQANRCRERRKLSKKGL
jgi:hypothetical protein